MSRQMAGFRAWFLQRATAVYLGLFIPIALINLLLDPPAGYTDWQGRLANPWVYGTVILFALSALLHAWIGMRDILLDYVKPDSVRIAALVALASSLVLLGFWLLVILITRVDVLG
ncbi:MAG: succinate dehydrogenase, hydrophobic membrane anchor protein [Gammaproteobacteria bacterium]|nr:succinate dehydrogenase, hydrophobic membrane anchor protein [Gammaproteobacteria bacterium]